MHAITELRQLARTLATEMTTIPLACRSWWDRHWALVDTRAALATRIVALARQAGPAPRSFTTDLLTAPASPPQGAEPFVATPLPIEATDWSWC